MTAILLSLIGLRTLDQVLTPGVSILSITDSRLGSSLIEERFDDPRTLRSSVVCAAGDGPNVPLGPTEGGSPVPSTPENFDISRCYRAKWAGSTDHTLDDSLTHLPDVPSDSQLGETAAAIETQYEQQDIIQFLLPPQFQPPANIQGRAGGFSDQIHALVRQDLVRAEIIAIPFTFLVLVLVIGTRLSAIVPILMSIAAIVVAAGLTAAAARAWPVSIYVFNMVVMLGLAVGVDYTLLVFQRYQEARRDDTSIAGALILSASTAGNAVLASGLTVIVSLAGMLFVPISVFRDIALGMMLVVILGVVAVTTLFPATVTMLGDRVAFHRSNTQKRSTRLSGVGFWSWWAAAATRHPVRVVCPVIIVLLALSSQSAQLQGGLSPFITAPALGEQSSQAEYWEWEFTATIMSVVEVVVDGSASEETGQGIYRLVDDIGRDQDFAPVLTIQTNAADDLTVIRMLVVRPSQSPDAANAVERLRSELIPSAFEPQSTGVYVSGPLALQQDIITIVKIWQPLVIGGVLCMCFVMLAALFRSVIVPVVATLLTLLSVTASLGVLVLIVQRGYGASLLGVDESATIEAWVPVVLFSILFGLSMDYHVFLVSRIQEQQRKTGDTTAAIAFSLQATGRVICAAAAIMGIVFAGFASGRLLFLQQAGLGLAVAVLLDAFLVRLMLVPAIMTMLGQWNWYIPTFPPRLPWRERVKSLSK